MKRIFSGCISLLVALCMLLSVAHRVWAESPKNHGNVPAVQGPGQHSALKDAENSAAAFRKSQGLMRYTTNDDRWAAAQNNATARAAALRNAKGGAHE